DEPGGATRERQPFSRWWGARSSGRPAILPQGLPDDRENVTLDSKKCRTSRGELRLLLRQLSRREILAIDAPAALSEEGGRQCCQDVVACATIAVHAAVKEYRMRQ